MALHVSRLLRLTLVLALLVGVGTGVTGDAFAAQRDPNVITRSGATLMLHGQAYRFTGTNAYELATYWSVNAGCGGQLGDAQLNAFFGGLRHDSVVRFWAFQAQGVNRQSHKIDFTGLDRVFRAAERNGQRLLAVLGNQAGTCDDGHWKDAAWYAGGYKQRFNDDRRGLNPVPYSSWVSLVVNRYKHSPALGMWEPVNEPEASDCPRGRLGDACSGHQTCGSANAAQALRSFFDAVGGQIKRLDPAHLVVSGVIGSGQCGASGADYARAHASPGIDVATYHDYGQDQVPVPGDQWNGMAVRIKQARALAKPLISEEVGIVSSAKQASGCVSTTTRARLLGTKLTAQLAAGSRGFLTWNYVPNGTAGCTYDIYAGDPTMTLLRRAAL